MNDNHQINDKNTMDQVSGGGFIKMYCPKCGSDKYETLIIRFAPQKSAVVYICKECEHQWTYNRDDTGGGGNF